MKVKRITSLRIIAAMAAISLIFIVIFITISFVGNPISSNIATKDIKTYIDEKYPSLNLEFDKATYNFKFGQYSGRAKSKTNIDIQFLIYWKNGEVIRDDYESYVLSGFNTLTRFSNEYSLIVTNILKETLHDSLKNANVMYSDKSIENNKNLLKPGMNFDKNLPLDTELTMTMNLKDSSIKKISEILSNSHKELKDKNCIFSKYGIYAENEGMLIMVNEVTPSDIESGKLEELLDNAKKNPNNSKIRVFIKGDGKARE